VALALEETVAAAAPLLIDDANFDDPTLLIAGDGWSLSALCPWRIHGSDGITLSWSMTDAGQRISQLTGLEIVSVGRLSLDATFHLSDGSFLDLFSDTDTDPFVLKLPNAIFVGPFRD